MCERDVRFVHAAVRDGVVHQRHGGGEHGEGQSEEEAEDLHDVLCSENRDQAGEYE